MGGAADGGGAMEAAVSGGPTALGDAWRERETGSRGCGEDSGENGILT